MDGIRNCLNFAKELCERLEVGRIPGWVMGLQNKINWTKRNLNKTTNKLKVYTNTYPTDSFRHQITLSLLTLSLLTQLKRELSYYIPLEGAN
eukprot:XP_766727.1 hypothetical protein [Theileria parva strain Muguga]